MENNVAGAWIIAIVTAFAAVRGILGFTVTDLPKIISLFSRKTL